VVITFYGTMVERNAICRSCRRRRGISTRADLLNARDKPRISVVTLAASGDLVPLSS